MSNEYDFINKITLQEYIIDHGYYANYNTLRLLDKNTNEEYKFTTPFISHESDSLHGFPIGKISITACELFFTITLINDTTIFFEQLRILKDHILKELKDRNIILGFDNDETFSKDTFLKDNKLVLVRRTLHNRVGIPKLPIINGHVPLLYKMLGSVWEKPFYNPPIIINGLTNKEYTFDQLTWNYGHETLFNNPLNKVQHTFTLKTYPFHCDAIRDHSVVLPIWQSSIVLENYNEWCIQFKQPILERLYRLHIPVKHIIDHHIAKFLY